jgi:uncharacterized phage protein (TIGR02218 family)
MVDVRIDQGGVYALAGVIPEVRADQAGIYALALAGNSVRVDQGGLYALIGVTAEVRVDEAGLYVLAGGTPCTMQWAQIWTITRLDGEVFRFTSLDRDLDWGEHTYQACNSLIPSASEAVSEVDAAGTMDLSGIVGEGGISELALFAGLFDGAYAEAWLVPWAGAGRPRRLLKGTFGPVEHGPNGFRVELLGDGAKLMQTPLVRLLQPGCDYVFGGTGCEKDLGPLTVTGTVDSATGQRNFVDAARAEAAGYFSGGRVTFTNGMNSGITAEIKEHGDGGSFELWPKLAFPIIAGVTYSMVPGCTHRKEASGGTNGCTAWANLLNYGGNPSVPGRDKRSAGANTREP